MRGPTATNKRRGDNEARLRGNAAVVANRSKVGGQSALYKALMVQRTATRPAHVSEPEPADLWEQAAAWICDPAAVAQYPLLSSHLLELDVVWIGSDWSSYNCFGNSLRQYRFIAPNEDVDGFYAKFDYVPKVGGADAATVHDILIYTVGDDDHRHAIVKDADGLWNSKMGDGPHIRLRDPDWLNGSAVGQHGRLYSKR